MGLTSVYMARLHEVYWRSSYAMATGDERKQEVPYMNFHTHSCPRSGKWSTEIHRAGHMAILCGTIGSSLDVEDVPVS